ncbi:Electron carrier/protein disulfide oxidoreductase [Quillaja saponaria]|uniref:Electron carrier/protein disulfide oxidoreductase n=1 Tax=Quillaja saponaria TaxID=32244 RepID=A0AAD7LJ13_QUISA|nr:Electron carrier/protein disulfide oxidoreductase [Quillaja saponaria]
MLEVDAAAFQDDIPGEPSKEVKALDIGSVDPKLDQGQDELSVKTNDVKSNAHEGMKDNVLRENDLGEKKDESRDLQSPATQESSDKRIQSLKLKKKSYTVMVDKIMGKNMDESKNLELMQANKKAEEILGEDDNLEPVFDGTEVPGMEAIRSTSTCSVDIDQETHGVVENAVALKNIIREKSFVAVSGVLRRLSGKSDEVSDEEVEDVLDFPKDSESKEMS